MVDYPPIPLIVCPTGFSGEPYAHRISYKFDTISSNILLYVHIVPMFDLVGEDDSRPPLVVHSRFPLPLILHQEPSFQEALMTSLDK